MKYDYTAMLEIGTFKNREFLKISPSFFGQRTFYISYSENATICHVIGHEVMIRDIHAMKNYR